MAGFTLVDPISQYPLSKQGNVMVDHLKRSAAADADTSGANQAASDEKRADWAAPSVTVIDLAAVTLAMGPGDSDAGIFGS